jgi:hypothetical protein
LYARSFVRYLAACPSVIGHRQLSLRIEDWGEVRVVDMVMLVNRGHMGYNSSRNKLEYFNAEMRRPRNMAEALCPYLCLGSQAKTWLPTRLPNWDFLRKMTGQGKNDCQLLSRLPSMPFTAYPVPSL